jgi:hypothetical protein
MALTEDSILGSFLPTVHISRFVINDNRIDLTLMVIDSTEGEEITSFLNERFLQEAISVKIIQSTDENLTNELASGIPVEQSLYRSAALVSETSTSPFSEPIIVNEPYRKVNLKDYASVEIDADGNKKYYYDISYNVSTNLKHISYAVYSDIDTESNYFKQELGIQLTSEETATIPRKTTIDTVIDNFQVKTKSYNYLLDNGTLWVGEVVFDEGRYETLEENPRNINLVEVPNYKVQDFRGRNLIKKNIVSDEFYDSTKKLLNLQPLPSNSTLSLRRPPMFGDINKIINSDKTISLSLYINIEEIIRQNSLYPNIITQKILNNAVSLFSLSLWRRKIKEVIGSQIIPEENEEPVMIDNNFIDNEIVLEPTYVRYFLMKDQSVSKIYEGKFQYGIKISFTDPAVDELKNRLIVLSSIRKSILEYYSFCELYTDPQTGYFEPIIATYFDENIIYNDNILPYLSCITNLNPAFNKSEIGELLKSNLSPINGSLDGISIFLKMIDDTISDICNLLSIANITPELLAINDNSLQKNTAKEMVEKIYYFKETVHDVTDYNKLELSYLNIKDGIVSYGNLLNSLYKESGVSDELYISPLLIDINNTKFYLEQFEDTSEDAKVQKFLLLKNKILEVNSNKGLYTSLDEFSITEKDSGQRNAFIIQLISQNNKLMENNLFFQNSVMFMNQTEASSRTYDQFLDINAVLNPKEFVTIPADKTKVNILKNLILDLNSEEHLFKYRLLNRVEYADFDTATLTNRWLPLTKGEISRLQNSNRINLLCRLVPYDYSSIDDLELKNINNFNYSKTFILDLSDRTSEDLFQAEKVVYEEKRINLTSDKTEINFKDIEIGATSTIRISLKLINDDEVNDIYCELENKNPKSSFKIEKNKFDLYYDKPETITISFQPEEVKKVQNTLLIYSLNKNELLKIKISANSIERVIKTIKSAPFKTTFSENIQLSNNLQNALDKLKNINVNEKEKLNETSNDLRSVLSGLQGVTNNLTSKGVDLNSQIGINNEILGGLRNVSNNLTNISNTLQVSPPANENIKANIQVLNNLQNISNNLQNISNNLQAKEAAPKTTPSLAQASSAITSNISVVQSARTSTAVSAPSISPAASTTRTSYQTSTTNLPKQKNEMKQNLQKKK